MQSAIFRKAQASILAVEERQTLEKLTREEKTSSRTFSQLKDRQEEFEQKRASLRENSSLYEEKRTDVRPFTCSHQRRTLTYRPLSWRIKSKRTASNYEKSSNNSRTNNLSGHASSMASTVFWWLYPQLIYDGSRLEAELNERLLEIHQKLMQAGFDQKETEREAKLKETLANLQRIFPGA